jgi:hypothetical protein
MRKFFLALLIAVLAQCAFAQQPAEPNSDPTYRQLRDGTVSGEAFTVSNLVLTRDAAKFKFSQGTFVFVPPVNGKVTTAVFVGDGQFIMTPPTPGEARMLSLLTKDNGGEIVETFHSAVFRFTDSTYNEVKRAGQPGQAPPNAQGDLQSFRDYARKTIQYNFDARLLADVLSTDPGGYFVAFIKGEKYSHKLLFTIDPHGAEDVEPEEISLRTEDENKWGIWSAFHLADEYTNGTARGTQDNATYDVEHQNLDTRIEKNGYLRGNALTTIVSKVGSLRAVGFNLFSYLRVSKVTDESGNPLASIQEDKDHDADYWVILPKALAKGEKLGIRTIYEGKNAVKSMGNGNYYPVARETWYPNTRFGRYSMYDMRFSTPKNIELVATGEFVKHDKEGDQLVSYWKTDVPEAVAGFNLGEFKKMEAKSQNGDFVVESYANTELPDNMAALKQYADNANEQQHGTLNLGSMNTTALMRVPLNQAALAVNLYSYYFGALPYKRLSMTQQTPCNYGQSWPSLVYLPICSYYDITVRHELGLDFDDRGYWTIVAPHEVAHQWWGHTVGFNSYRDQWMSEGFADFSASLFIQGVINDPKQYRKFWQDEYDLITERNNMGFRAMDAGPIILGYRLNTTRTGNVTRRLIYPKGAFILQMIRMMMWDNQTGDANFRAMMQDFVKTYYNRPASTEDFKEVVERHLLPSMDLDRNHKMDWFFNEYVYGTAFPIYHSGYSFDQAQDGTVNIRLKIVQSGVDDNFKMSVPVYLELADGHVVPLGAVGMAGNYTFDQTIAVKLGQQIPKRIILAYNYDVLGSFQ